MSRLTETTAAEVMSTSVLQCSRTETIHAASERMLEHGVHSLVVPHPSPDRLPGIVTLRDVVDIMAAESEEALTELLVEDAMTWPALTVQAESCLKDCINQMRQFGARTVPVMRANELVGVLTFTDVVRFASGISRAS